MKNRKNLPSLLVLTVLFVITLGSCNRGYGCPYDFSIGSAIENAFAMVISFVVGLF
ncbi:MAG: hypothetical protein IPM48_12940 [Saprospiraceae bacterium]|nr:hypothetical protein [Saprospiraceae bacterium]